MNAVSRVLAPRSRWLPALLLCLAMLGCAEAPPLPTPASPPPIRQTRDLLLFEQGDPAKPAPAAPRCACPA